jgi:ABC-type branched-subunit amino acid transport system permease subunit
MATLGFALIGELIANNWVQVTGGPDCVGNVSLMALPSGLTLGLSEQGQEYYIFLGLAVAVGAGIRLLVSSRIGRAFVAVREDEPMAMSVGMNPRRYRLAAFVASGAIAGLIGAFYAHYLTVVCPTNLDISYTVNLLVILFLGGTGGFWGIVAAAFVVTAIPELLQVAPNVRLIAYGVVLLVGVTLMPFGVEGIAKRMVQKWRLRRTRHDA